MACDNNWGFLFIKGRDFLAVISYIMCIIDLFISIVQYANLHYLDDNLMEQPTLQFSWVP
jgi:hypothetical protein